MTMEYLIKSVEFHDIIEITKEKSYKKLYNGLLKYSDIILRDDNFFLNWETESDLNKFEQYLIDLKYENIYGIVLDTKNKILTICDLSLD